MAYEFTVTKIGIVTGEGPAIMPGSRLVLKNPPPAAWSGLGELTSKNVQEMRLVVASPGAASAASETPEEIAQLQADYERLLGRKPHHRLGADALRRAIAEATE